MSNTCSLAGGRRPDLGLALNSGVHRTTLLLLLAHVPPPANALPFPCPRACLCPLPSHPLPAAVGLRTTSTIMFGHCDAPRHWARHLAALRDLQVGICILTGRLGGSAMMPALLESTLDTGLILTSKVADAAAACLCRGFLPLGYLFSCVLPFRSAPAASPSLCRCPLCTWRPRST